jgi:hypothetical protein
VRPGQPRPAQRQRVLTPAIAGVRAAAALSLVTMVAGCQRTPPPWVAVEADRSVVVLGNDGQVGVLGEPDAGVPDGQYDMLRAADRTTCGIDATGRPDCWSTNAGLPMSGVPAGPFVNMDVAAGYAVFLFEDGDAMYWPQTHAPLPDGEQWAVAALGTDAALDSCGITLDGELYCSDLDSPAPRGPWTHVEKEGAITCALDTDGAASCFDRADDAWAEVAAPEASWRVLDYGNGVACGLTESGQIACLRVTSTAEDWLDAVPTTSGWTDISVSRTGAFACGINRAKDVECFGKSGSAPTGELVF